MSYLGADRRTSPELLRQAWREVFLASTRGWKLFKRAASTAAMTMAGSLAGWLGYALFGGYAPALAAQAPITITPGGADAILWLVFTGVCGLLLAILKSWRDSVNVQLEAQRVALAKLTEELAFLKGQHHRAND